MTAPKKPNLVIVNGGAAEAAETATPPPVTTDDPQAAAMDALELPFLRAVQKVQAAEKRLAAALVAYLDARSGAMTFNETLQLARLATAGAKRLDGLRRQAEVVVRLGQSRMIRKASKGNLDL